MGKHHAVIIIIIIVALIIALYYFSKQGMLPESIQNMLPSFFK